MQNANSRLPYDCTCNRMSKENNKTKNCFKYNNKSN